MSRDYGTYDEIYEESMVSHDYNDATSIHDMEEHYTNNGSSCGEYFLEHGIDFGSPSLEDMEHFNDHDDDPLMRYDNYICALDIAEIEAMREEENHQDATPSTLKFYNAGGTTYYDSPPRSRR